LGYGKFTTGNPGGGGPTRQAHPPGLVVWSNKPRTRQAAKPKRAPVASWPHQKQTIVAIIIAERKESGKEEWDW